MTGSQAKDGWQQAEDQQLRDAQRSTPLQRLEWLEGAILFAWKSGALKRHREAQVEAIEAGWA